MLLPFIGIIVFTGVYPKPMLDRIEPSVNALIAHVEREAPATRNRSRTWPTPIEPTEEGADR